MAERFKLRIERAAYQSREEVRAAANKALGPNGPLSDDEWAGLRPEFQPAWDETDVEHVVRGALTSRSYARMPAVAAMLGLERPQLHVALSLGLIARIASLTSQDRSEAVAESLDDEFFASLGRLAAASVVARHEQDQRAVDGSAWLAYLLSPDGENDVPELLNGLVDDLTWTFSRLLERFTVLGTSPAARLVADDAGFLSDLIRSRAAGSMFGSGSRHRSLASAIEEAATHQFWRERWEMANRRAKERGTEPYESPDSYRRVIQRHRAKGHDARVLAELDSGARMMLAVLKGEFILGIADEESDQDNSA